MPPNPLVSVITPTFGMADRIERCIRSISEQSYPNVEHVVVDGGSTDGTIEILQRSSGVRWVSEPDRGQSDAINKGLRTAAGDVIGWLNADDELAPGAIRRIVDALAANPLAGLAYGDIDVVEPDRTWRLDASPTFGMSALWRGTTIWQPGTFWTRWAQEAVGEIDEEFHLAMDFEYWLRFAKAGIDGVHVPHVLARFEIHDSSKTGVASKLDFAEEEARALRKHGEIHGAAMAIDRWYWADVVQRVGEAARAGRGEEARATAREALGRMHPIRSRPRLFLLLAAIAPRAAALLHRAAGRPGG